MTKDDLIALCRAKLVNLSALRTSAEQLGDARRIDELDTEITQTQLTLDELLG